MSDRIMLFASGNGDDNLILALCVDKVSQNDKIKFTLGEEETEVSPCCVLLCVTIDGKLSLFHFVRYLDLCSLISQGSYPYLPMIFSIFTRRHSLI